jgi:hypothetical protein
MLTSNFWKYALKMKSSKGFGVQRFCHPSYVVLEWAAKVGHGEMVLK